MPNHDFRTIPNRHKDERTTINSLGLVGDMDPKNLINTGKIGLLDGSGTYNVDRYPWAYQAWKKQQQIHWIGEEVPLSEDLKDWNSERLTMEERNLLTQIFRFFTQSDIEVSDNYFKRYIPIFQPLEIQMMMAAFTNMETVHIDAYALLLTTLGMPKTEFSAFKEYGAMTAKADYMQSFGVKTCSDVARTLAMFGAFTEGLSLFASFAMLMNFPRFNKMKGMGQVVSWSVRDESLHCESMITLYHEWAKETGSVTQSVKDDIVDVAQTMIQLEDRFIELAFALGDIKGLSMLNMKNYIRYICDWRLVQLQLPTLFGYFDERKQLRDHPLPWLPLVLNGVEHANFFESRPTEYSKGATQGEWHGEEGTWSRFEKYIQSRQ
jgi:ribonucleoside-diphosphate reductase beta chain